MMCTLTAGTAMAQWNTNRTPVRIFDGTSNSDYVGVCPIVKRAANGKFWMSYLVSEKEPYGVHMYLQLYDKDLIPQFEGGIRVNSYPTNTAWSNYTLDVTSDGCAVVSWCDARGEEPTVHAGGDVSYYNFEPFYQKVDQEGNLLWGLDGVRFPQWTDDIPLQTSADVLTNDDVIVQAKGVHFAYMARINPDGEVVMEPQQMAGQVVPVSDSNFLLFYGGAQVARFTKDLQTVWGPVEYDSYSYVGYEMDPYKIAPDGKDGAAVAFARTMGQFSHNIRVQYINGDGELGFGLEAIDAWNAEEYDHDYPRISLNPETEEILVDWESQTSESLVSASKFNYSGDRLWGENGMVVAHKTVNSYSYGSVGSHPMPNGDWLLAWKDLAGYFKMQLRLKRVDKDGNKVWGPISIGNNIDIDHINMLWDDEATYFFWRDNNKMGLYAFRIFNDSSYEPKPSGIDDVQDATATAAACYTPDGKRLSEPQHGLNIVRMTDGTAKKVIK